MTTQVLPKQSGSVVSQWTNVGGKPGTTYGTADPIFLEVLAVTADAGVPHGDIRAEFERLAAEWKQETAHLSSPYMVAQHRAYQEIIGMGKDAIPLILEDLQQTKAEWFWALRSIARESPVQSEDRGDIDAMTDAWIEWGKKHWYIHSVAKKVTWQNISGSYFQISKILP